MRLIPFGEIATTHGLDGWLKLNPYNPETTGLSFIDKIYIEEGGQSSAYELESSKPHRKQFLIKLRGVDLIGDAEKNVGLIVSIAEESLPKLDPGEFYLYQAVGLEVVDGAGTRVGIVTRTWATTGGQFYVVQNGKKELFIPAVKEIVDKVDFAAGKMIINPPEGLLDL
ncbi:MAG TPA: ribosome maturation factor RimM [Candidatus Acidoferrales bacterium]|nr:ribosome maturation factor RimM [Candidatus Acidoferrales bacterium]